MLKTNSTLFINSMYYARPSRIEAPAIYLIDVFVSFSHPSFISDPRNSLARFYAFALSDFMRGLHFGTLSSLKTVPEKLFRTYDHLFQGRILFQIHLSGVASVAESHNIEKAKLQERKGIASAPRPCALFSFRSRAGKLFPAYFSK